MDTTNKTVATMTLSGNTYAIRDEIRRAGGKYDGATRTWTVTEEQLADLVADAEASARRSNKRDRAFGVAWAGVRVSTGATAPAMGRCRDCNQPNHLGASGRCEDCA